MALIVASCSPELLFEAPEVSSVTVTGSASSLTVGEAVTLSAVVRQVNGASLEGAAVEWQSTNPAVATVSTEGRVVAVGAGTATIRASFAGITGPYGITVRSPVATVTLSPTSSTLAPGGTQQLTATLQDASSNLLTGRVVAWSSSNTAVAAVSTTGAVTAGAAGTATITATSEGRSGTATITVTAPAVPVATVTLSPTSATLAPGGTQQLTATLRDASNNLLTGRVVAWSSSNTAVAAVSATGVVTAGAVGTATITATSEGRSGTATITVTSSVGLCQNLSLNLSQTVSGSLLPGDCTYAGGELFDRWVVSLPSTTAVVSTLSSTVFAPATGALGTTGNYVAVFERATTGSSVVEWLLPAGTYGFDVLASTLAPVTSGAYTFRVASVSSDTTSCGGSVAAARGVTIGRSLGSNDCIGTRGREDRIWIYLTAGQTLTATMTSAFDAYLLLYAANGTTLLQSDDDSAGGTNARIVYTAPQSGYLQVRPTVFTSTSTGAYTISLSW